MTQLSHNFEGGTDGVTVASGSGSNSDTPGNNFFDAVNRDATGTVAFSNVQRHAGLLACRFQVGSVVELTSLVWSTSRGSITDDYFRGYFYLGAAFTFNQPLLRWFTAAVAEMGQVMWDTGAGNKISIRDHNFSIIATSTNALTVGAWHRIEAHHFASATVAQITVKLFIGSNVDGTTPDETLTSPTFAPGGATTGRIDMGLAQPQGASDPSGNYLYMDDIVDGAATWVGPSSQQASVINGTPAQLVNVNAAGIDVDALTYKTGVQLTQPEIAALAATSGVMVTADGFTEKQADIIKNIIRNRST